MLLHFLPGTILTRKLTVYVNSILAMCVLNFVLRPFAPIVTHRPRFNSKAGLQKRMNATSELKLSSLLLFDDLGETSPNEEESDKP